MGLFGDAGLAAGLWAEGEEIPAGGGEAGSDFFLEEKAALISWFSKRRGRWRCRKGTG